MRSAWSDVVVLLTRASDDNAPLAAALGASAARVIQLPCVHTEPADETRLAAAIRALTADDRLVLTSRAGAEAVLRALEASEIRAPIAAVGPGTARPLAEAGLAPDVVGDGTGASLGRNLPLPPGRVLLARADRAGHELPDVLRRRGARVDEVVAYRTVVGAVGDATAIRRAFRESPLRVVVFASPSAIDGLIDAIPPEELRGAHFVAIGPTTARAVEARLETRAFVAQTATVAGILDAIERCLDEVIHVARR